LDSIQCLSLDVVTRLTILLARPLTGDVSCLITHEQRKVIVGTPKKALGRQSIHCTLIRYVIVDFDIDRRHVT